MSPAKAPASFGVLIAALLLAACTQTGNDAPNVQRVATTPSGASGSAPVGVNTEAARQRAGLFGGSIPRRVDDPILRARSNIARNRSDRLYGPNSDFLRPNERIFITTSPRRVF